MTDTVTCAPIARLVCHDRQTERAIARTKDKRFVLVERRPVPGDDGAEWQALTDPVSDDEVIAYCQAVVEGAPSAVTNPRGLMTVATLVLARAWLQQQGSS